MPNKTINDYTFYKIVCLDNSVELCYIGSTANWKERRRQHRFNCNNENSKKYNLKIYKTIRDNGGWDNFKMIEIGKKDQLTKRQAEQVEEEYRQKFKANMNAYRCFTTDEQKQEHRKVWNKEYRQANRAKLNESRSEKIVCECGCEIRRDNLMRHKLSDKHKQIMENK